MANLCVRCEQTGPIDRMVIVVNPWHNGPAWIEVCVDCIRLGDRVVGPEDDRCASDAARRLEQAGT